MYDKGDKIESYRVIRLLGTGGMGEVYEVEHISLCVMRRSGYDRGRSRFRAYLVSLMKHILIDRQRRRTVRRMDETETLNDAFIRSPGPDAAELVDMRLRHAEREAALKHLETNSAVPAEHIAIYRAYAIDGEKAKPVAERYSVSVANVLQIKRRLSLALKALG